MGELYGEYNLLTNEWTDGLGSTLIRNAVTDTTPDMKWVVFDGPVDAVWIENMNTGVITVKTGSALQMEAQRIVHLCCVYERKDCT